MEVNNYKAFIKAFKLIFFAAICTSCNQDPKDTLEKYLELTYQENKPEKAYNLLSRDDQKFKTEEQFIIDHKRKNIFHSKLRKKYKDQYFFEINEDYLSGDTVKIKATLFKPGSNLILKEMLVYAMASSTDMTDSETDRLLEKHYENLVEEGEKGLVSEEREFTLIREDGEYRLFFNYGEPYRQELLNKRLDDLNEQAEERIRRMDYESALTIYREMLVIRNDNSIHQKIKDVNEILSQQITLGQKKEIGNLLIKPLKIEVKNILLEKKNWLDGGTKKELSKEKYFVMTFLVNNQFEGEFFNLYEAGRYKRHHLVRDNYGNEMSQYLPDFDIVSVEENPAGKILPGETRIMKAVCEAPLSSRAEKFVWEMKLIIDNKSTSQEVMIRFNRKDILFSN